MASGPVGDPGPIGLLDFAQSSFHLIPRVEVCCFLCSSNAARKDFSCFLPPIHLRQELAVVKVCRDVVGPSREQLLEILYRRLVISGVLALHSESVAGERVRGVGGDEFLEFLAP